jgi:hypothetical protein
MDGDGAGCQGVTEAAIIVAGEYERFRKIDAIALAALKSQMKFEPVSEDLKTKACRHLRLPDALATEYIIGKDPMLMGADTAPVEVNPNPDKLCRCRSMRWRSPSVASISWKT